ncbi:cytotoxic translational repressor of toxin-antitoxin stability system [Pasteurellaceae bacterium Pebbles2]|nr:cytotoxic translational repressor of toxin-antitoxin stability system [Pasteurellaceae bacterium Pebbles2]
MVEIIFQPKAMKQLRKIPQGIEIYERCAELKHFPYCRNVKTLTNHKYQYRFRVGNYRVLFNIQNDIMSIVSIEEVRKRDDNTY